MPKELLLKLVFYTILPCILAFTASYLNGLFHPQLQWNVKLLESRGETYRIENQGINTTTLFNQPALRAYSKEGYSCSTIVDWVYVQNQTLQDKLILEKWVNINNSFAFWIAFLAVFHAIVDVMYLLKLIQRLGWGGTVASIFFVAIGAIILITIFGPIKGGPIFSCWAQIKVQAELTKISLTGMIYPFLGAIADILAVIIMIKRYTLKSVSEEIDLSST